MRHINEVASWFNQNNILKKNEKEDNLRINLLCLYTKVAYTIKGLELECDEISFDEKLNINIGITNINLEPQFTNEELRILKTINRVYGYLKIKGLLYDFTQLKCDITIKNIITELENEVSDFLEGHKNYDFNEKTIIINNKVFFVNNNLEITEELIKKLKRHKFQDQYIFTVFDWDNSNEPIIY